jgi:hypothetical protein
MLGMLFIALFQSAAGDPPVIQPGVDVPPPAQGQTTEAEEQEMECRRETQLGSRRPRLVCVPVEEVEARRERDRRRWRDGHFVPEAPENIGGAAR